MYERGPYSYSSKGMHFPSFVFSLSLSLRRQLQSLNTPAMRLSSLLVNSDLAEIIIIPVRGTHHHHSCFELTIQKLRNYQGRSFHGTAYDLPVSLQGHLSLSLSLCLFPQPNSELLRYFFSSSLSQPGQIWQRRALLTVIRCCVSRKVRERTRESERQRQR